MKYSFIALIITLCLVSQTQASIYSVIVAGSSGWSNYRHQADVCHAYQLLVSNGVPKNNIVLMAFNDIAYNIQNPYPGQLFNIGTPNKKGDNVYEGCVIDYEGLDVSKSNYFAILNGDKDGVKGGSGRVLESGPDDEVFLFYSDHGNVGYVKFPDPKGYTYKDGETEMFGDELVDVIVQMKKNQKFDKLTYYMNACHSGSLFTSLPDDINVYTMTAANADQSGYGCFCPPDGDRVDGVYIDTCLSSQFPASWMQNTEYTDTNAESLQQQFEFSKFATTSSEVQNWGDKTMTDLKVATFLGGENQQDKPIVPSQAKGFKGKVEASFKQNQYQKQIKEGIEQNIWEQKTIETNHLLLKFQKNPSTENYNALQQNLAITNKFSKVFKEFNQEFQLDGKLTQEYNYKCYRQILGKLQQSCGRFNDQSLDFSKYLLQYCEKYQNADQVNFDCSEHQLKPIKQISE